MALSSSSSSCSSLARVSLSLCPATATATANETIRQSNIEFPTKPNFLNTPLSSSFSFSQEYCSSSSKKRTSTITKVSFFPAFFTKTKDDPNVLKLQLLEAIQPLDRGAEATLEDQRNIDQLVRKLEAVNPTKEPLKSGLLDGKWELIYTTSESILQTKRPKFLRSRVNYQAINVDTLRAQNMETWPFFNQVTADLTPVNSRKVDVKFDYFKIGGLIPVKALDTALGSLEITYLDEDLRVSRGDKGNLFILKMVDRKYKIPS